MAPRSRRSRPHPIAPAVSRRDEPAPANPMVAMLHAECAKLAAEELPLRVAYERFLDLVHQVLPFGHGTLYVADWTSGKLLPVAVRGNRVELADQIKFARGRGLSAWAAQEGRAVVIPDPEQREQTTVFADEALRAFLAFPLVQQGVVAGVVSLARTDRTFAEEEFERLGLLASSLAQTLFGMRRDAQVRDLIFLDAETGLSSSHHFMARLDQELQRTRQHGTEFALALLELPTPVRSGLTQHLCEVIRSCDLVAHLGEGRVGVLLAGVNREKATGIVNRLTQVAVRELRPASGDAVHLRLGLVTSAELKGAPVTLLQQAAAAMADIA